MNVESALSGSLTESLFRQRADGCYCMSGYQYWLVSVSDDVGATARMAENIGR